MHKYINGKSADHFEKEFDKIRKDYFHEVYAEVISKYDKRKDEKSITMLGALWNTDNYEIFDDQVHPGMSLAGRTYLLMNYGLTGKMDYETTSKINHYQTNLIDKTVYDIGIKYDKKS